MKKIMILAISAMLVANVSAQEFKKECNKKQFTKEERVEFDIKRFTNELMLSDEQAAKFAVTYREYTAKLDELFEANKPAKFEPGKELTDALIRQCLGSDDAVITRNERGKPFVCLSGKDGDDRVFISVSHSEDTFAVIEADRNIGLDIQYPRSVKADRIAARFFTQDSYKMFLFRSYARTMRDIATGLEDQEEVAEILFDCHFCTILEEVAEKVWQHFNP